MTAPQNESAAAEAAAALDCTAAELANGSLEAMRDEVLRGLRSTPKTLPPKLFYDAAGAEIFEAITKLPEYYLTRTELTILEERAAEIAELTGPRCTLVEYGSGAGVKVRLLLDALWEPAAYVPIDISREQLSRVAAQVAADYPELIVRPVCADYTRPLSLPQLPHEGRTLAFFPGSTIGNFHPTEAASFLRRVRRLVRDGGALVLGVDRRKDAATLNAAYDDAAGVTAAFNLNLLARLNRDLGATFDLDRFTHRAFFESEKSRVEMHLVSLARQIVTVAGERLVFAEGETIHTECSYKYDRPRLEQIAAAGGFEISHLWTDPDDRFWLAFLVPA